jgi:hypothetical protein
MITKFPEYSQKLYEAGVENEIYQSIPISSRTPDFFHCIVRVQFGQ